MAVDKHMPNEESVGAIKADLASYEAERGKAHAAVQWRVPVFLGGMLVGAFLIALFFNTFANRYEQWLSTPHVILYVGVFAGAFFVYVWAMRPATQLQQSLRDKILPSVFGFIENVTYRRGYTPDSYSRLPREAVDSHNRRNFDDLVVGRYEGFPFELYEATLSQKSGKSTVQVFKGVIVAFETAAPFPGLLVAARRKGAVTKFFRGLFGANLTELQSGVPSLDEAYEFRTDNPGAAQPLVTGRLAKAMQWLTETWPEQPARVALSGRDGFLLIPVKKNFFELPGISVPLDYRTHIEPMVADLASLLATAALVRQVGLPDDAPAAQP